MLDAQVLLGYVHSSGVQAETKWVSEQFQKCYNFLGYLLFQKKLLLLESDFTVCRLMQYVSKTFYENGLSLIFFSNQQILRHEYRKIEQKRKAMRGIQSLVQETSYQNFSRPCHCASLELSILYLLYSRVTSDTDKSSYFTRRQNTWSK